jgi:hypothetical protein
VTHGNEKSEVLVLGAWLGSANLLENKSGRRESNPRRPDWEIGQQFENKEASTIVFIPNHQEPSKIAIAAQVLS